MFVNESQAEDENVVGPPRVDEFLEGWSGGGTTVPFSVAECFLKVLNFSGVPGRG